MRWTALAGPRSLSKVVWLHLSGCTMGYRDKNGAVASAILQSESDALVVRGRIAWGRLKEDAPKRRALSRGSGANAKERRERSQNDHRLWWIQVGQALLVGKRMAKTDHGYYAWLRANGFEDVPRSARQDAIWFASNMTSLGELPEGLASPGTIRQWAYKRAKASSVAPSTPNHAGVVLHKGPPAEIPQRSEVARSLGQPGAGNLPDMARVADLILEASKHMQRGVELLSEVAQLIRKAA